jgi:multidrug efflux pump subunit AcrB
MLCILAVFLPSFFMQGAARALFVPLSLAVGFAMVASYLLSNTFVPVLSVWLLQHHRPADGAERRTPFVRLREAYAALAGLTVRWRWAVLSAYVVVAGMMIWLAGSYTGREIFPKVDAGQFQLRLRGPTGTRIERTREITQEALKIIQNKVGAENVAISLGYVGVVASSYPINAVHQWMGGPEEAVVRVALRKGSGFSTEALKEELRQELPQRLEEWLRPKLTDEGFTPKEIEERVKGLRLSFEPADIVNTVMSFGSPTPVEIAVSGTILADNVAHAGKIKERLGAIGSMRDLQFAQSQDYPTILVKLDRQLIGQSKLAAENIARSLLTATSSSRFVVPNYWRDPKSGIAYQVQVEIPIERMNSAKEVGLIPVKHASEGKLLLQDVAKIEPSTMPGEYDRYNMRRLVSMTANIQGEDLGRVTAWIASAIRDANQSLWSPALDEKGDRREDKGKPGWKNGLSGEIVYQPDQPVTPPRGMQVDVRGQVEPMQTMFGGLAGGSWFSGLTLGLGMAVVVIFLLLAGYFQSLRLAFVVVTTAPAVVAGVALALVITGTTLNIQSFMGAIMAIGVATANAILLITLAERARRSGVPLAVAAVDGAQHRLRPILMTSCAMIAGMVPMALAFGEGGQQVAPLGRAVIGGLLAATAATLLILPCVFTIVLRGAGTRSVSLDPDDPESPHYDPHDAAQPK